jgi:hypothetical protein
MVALGDKKQVRCATEALAKELGVKISQAYAALTSCINPFVGDSGGPLRELSRFLWFDGACSFENLKLLTYGGITYPSGGVVRKTGWKQ